MIDVELTQERRSPVSSKICRERIDDYATQARGIVELAEKESREPTDSEFARFNELVDERIPAWKQELEAAITWEKNLVTHRLNAATALDSRHERPLCYFRD